MVYDGDQPSSKSWIRTWDFDMKPGLCRVSAPYLEKLIGITISGLT